MAMQILLEYGFTQNEALEMVNMPIEKFMVLFLRKNKQKESEEI